MEQKPVIQYVGQFYVYGSEVQSQKKKQDKKRTLLPKMPKLRKEHCIYVDPVAVCGIAAAVVILVALVVGAIGLHDAMDRYNAQSAVLASVKRENARLEHQYRTSLDLEAVQARAEKLGMVPVEELETKQVRVHVKKAPEAPSAWDNFLWFVKGLLNGVDESKAKVYTDWTLGGA